MKINVKISDMAFFLIGDVISNKFSPAVFENFASFREVTKSNVLYFVITAIKDEKIEEFKSIVEEVFNKLENSEEPIYLINIDVETIKCELRNLAWAIRFSNDNQLDNKINIIAFFDKDNYFTDEIKLNVAVRHAMETDGHEHPYLGKHVSELVMDKKAEQFTSSTVEDDLDMFAASEDDCAIFSSKYISSVTPSEYFNILDTSFRKRKDIYIITDIITNDNPARSKRVLAGDENPILALTSAYKLATKEIDNINYFAYWRPEGIEDGKIAGFKVDFPTYLDFKRYIVKTTKGTKQKSKTTTKRKKK